MGKYLNSFFIKGNHFLQIYNIFIPIFYLSRLSRLFVNVSVCAWAPLWGCWPFLVIYAWWCGCIKSHQQLYSTSTLIKCIFMSRSKRYYNLPWSCQSLIFGIIQCLTEVIGENSTPFLITLFFFTYIILFSSYLAVEFVALGNCNFFFKSYIMAISIYSLAKYILEFILCMVASQTVCHSHVTTERSLNLSTFLWTFNQGQCLVAFRPKTFYRS